MGTFYLLLCLCLYIFQWRLQYMPTRMSLAATREKAAEAGLALWPADDAEYRGFLAEPEDGATSGTVVVVHGNAGDAIDRDFLVPLFRVQGLRVILLEYPGYGARPGRVGEARVVPDIRESLEHIDAEFDGPLYVIGESLGAGAASAALRDTTAQVDGLALITPFDTLPNLAAQRFWFVPARLLLTDRYDNIVNLRGYAGPIAVYTAGEDEIIPARRSQALYASLNQRRRLVVLPGVGHNTWPERFGRREARELVEWWQAEPALQSPP